MVHFNTKYNTGLKWWIDSHPKNISWLSHDIQNDLLNLLAVEVIARIASDCRGRLFSVICDEVSDLSNNELLSIVVRYVLDSGHVQQSLIALVAVERTNAACLSEELIKILQQLNLSLDNGVGQRGADPGGGGRLGRSPPKRVDQKIFGG